jgi:hypothetical protein
MSKSRSAVVVVVTAEWNAVQAAFITNSFTKTDEGMFVFTAFLKDARDPIGLWLSSSREDVVGQLDTSKLSLLIPWRFVVSVMEIPNQTETPNVAGFVPPKKSKL